MGIGGLFKRMFSGGAAAEESGPPDETRLADSDAELRALWAGRESLGGSDASEVRLEFVLRRLAIPPAPPRPSVSFSEVDIHKVPTRDAALAPLWVAAPVTLGANGFVHVAGTDDNGILAVPGSWRPATSTGERPGHGPIAGVLATPLDDARVGARANAIAQAQAVPVITEAGDIAGLAVAPTEGGWRITTADGAHDVLVGLIPIETLSTVARPTLVVGGIRWPSDEDGWKALAASWDPDGGPPRAALLIETLLGHDLAQSCRALPPLGVAVRTTGHAHAPSPGAQPLVRHALRPIDAPEATFETSADLIVDAAAFLIFDGAEDAAAQMVAKALEASSDSPTMQLAAGLVSAWRGDDAAARGHFEAAQIDGQLHPLAATMLAYAAFEDGDRAQAATLAAAAVAGDHPDVTVLFNHIVGAWLAGDRDAALTTLGDAQNEMRPWLRALVESWIDGDAQDTARMIPVVAGVRRALTSARQCLREGRRDAARALVARCLEIDPLPIDAMALAIAIEPVDSEVRSRLLDDAIARFPRCAPLRAWRGHRRMLADDPTNAADDFAAAVASAPEDTDSAVNLIQALIASDDLDAAADALRDLVTSEDEDEDVLEALQRRLKRARR